MRPVGSGSLSTQSTRVLLGNVYWNSNAASGSRLRTNPSSCTSPKAPRERLSPSNSCKLTTLLARPSIFFCASSILLRCIMTLVKVSLVFLKPSSRRSETLPPISSRRSSTALISASMRLLICCAALPMVVCINACSALPCSANVVCNLSKTLILVCARLAVCAICNACMASRVCLSSSATEVRSRSLLSCETLCRRSASLLSPSCRSSSMALYFSSRSLLCVKRQASHSSNSSALAAIIRVIISIIYGKLYSMRRSQRFAKRLVTQLQNPAALCDTQSSLTTLQVLGEQTQTAAGIMDY